MVFKYYNIDIINIIILFLRMVLKILVFVLCLTPLTLFCQTRQHVVDSLIYKRHQEEEMMKEVQNQLAILVTNYKDVFKWLTLARADSSMLVEIPCIFPLKRTDYNEFLTSSPFGYRLHPIYKYEKFHNGIDIPDSKGTPVYATANGVVEFSGYKKGDIGVCVIINHKFAYQTLYGHLSTYTVKNGEIIKQGQMIGRVGKTGTATGYHLHYIIKKNGKSIDPYKFCFLRLDLLKVPISR